MAKISDLDKASFRWFVWMLSINQFSIVKFGAEMSKAVPTLSGQTRARMFPTETASYKRAIFFYFSALRSIVYTVTENVSFVLRMCIGNVITVIQGLAYNALRFRWISFLFIFVFDCCEVLSLFNILFKTKPVSFRLTDSRDIPLLDTRDYSSNWQNKVLER